MKNRGLLIVLSGFSGTGKGTIVKEVLRQAPERYVLSVSATTRRPRDGEQHGREYFFLSDADFSGMIEQDELLEHAGYVGHYYGTPRAYVEENLAEGRNVILEIECQGAMQIRRKMPGAVLIFILPPSAAELERRLRGRGTESEEEIRGRLRRAAEETAFIRDFDYVIVNDVLDDAVSAFFKITEAECCRTVRRSDLIGRIENELNIK